MTSGTRCTASPACFTTVVATRFARATGDCLRVRFRPPLRLRPDERLRAEPRADDLRRDDLRPDDLRADDFRPPDLRRADFLPVDFRPPRRPPDRDLPRDDRLFVAMVLLSQ
jgi:hypothetical protein